MKLILSGFLLLFNALFCSGFGGSANLEFGNVDANMNANIDPDIGLPSLGLPCGLGKDKFGVGYWVKEKLSISVIKCLCELKETKIGSLAKESYDLFVKTTGIDLISTDCTQGDEEDNSTPADLTYDYDIELEMIYIRKYDSQFYLDAPRYTWNNEDVWITYNEGINESNQPKFRHSSANAIIDGMTWTRETFDDLSICQEYPENSLQYNLVQAFNAAIFGGKGCSIEPGTNVTVLHKNPVMKMTSDFKFHCGVHNIFFTMQSSDDKDALGVYYTFNIANDTDCIDFSIESERENAGLKKLVNTYEFEIERRQFAVIDRGDTSYMQFNKKAKRDEDTFVIYRNGLDSESDLIFKSTNWYSTSYREYDSSDSSLLNPCDENQIELSLGDVFLHIVKHVIFDDQDCPIEVGFNASIPMTYSKLSVNSNAILTCGNNAVKINLYQDNGKSRLLNMVVQWDIPKTAECFEY